MSHTDHNNAIQVYAVTVMTQVKALEARQPSQGEFEPITLAYPGLRLGATAVVHEYTGIITCIRVHKRYIEYHARCIQQKHEP